MTATQEIGHEYILINDLGSNTIFFRVSADHLRYEESRVRLCIDAQPLHAYIQRTALPHQPHLNVELMLTHYRKHLQGFTIDGMVRETDSINYQTDIRNKLLYVLRKSLVFTRGTLS